MTDNYGEWWEREMVEAAAEQRDRDVEWGEWEEEQSCERLARHEPTKGEVERKAAA